MYSMKILLPCLALLFVLASCSDDIPQTPIQINGALSVKGNQIINKDGEAVSLAGNSLFWSNTGWGGEDFYQTSVVDWLYEDWGATIVRAAMGVDKEGGYIVDATNKEKTMTIVDAAIDKGMYVIIDWHSHYAEHYEKEAITFFQDMATLYGKHANVIYEIYNEPLDTTSWERTIKPYAEAVIKAIRAIDPDNLIIVGSSTWSQDVDEVSKNPITDYSNIAYTLHFYAGSHGQELRDKAQVALDNGIALMVTEWGSVNADGDGAVAESSVQEWMDFLCKNKISHCNWAINDKQEGASAVKPQANDSGNWTSDDLTPSGILVKDLILNWKTHCSKE